MTISPSNEQEHLDAVLNRMGTEARELISGYDQELATLEQRVAELKELRSRATKAINYLETGSATGSQKPGPKPGANGSAPPAGVRPELLAEMRAWLTDHALEPAIASGFSTAIANRADFAWAGSTANRAFKILHEQGFLRLDRRGTGGSRIYRIA